MTATALSDAVIEALIERLETWRETPNEGDPMIDALLADVPQAADALRLLLACRRAGEVDRFGNRRVPKMYAQVNELRQAIAAEGSPRVQAAWDKVEEHIDFAYQQAGQAPIAPKLAGLDAKP